MWLVSLVSHFLTWFPYNLREDYLTSGPIERMEREVENWLCTLLWKNTLSLSEVAPHEA